MLSLTPYRKNRVAAPDDVVNFYDMVDHFFNDVQSPFKGFEEKSFKIDVKENDNEYLVDAELAGYDKDEVRIRFDDGRLMISAEKKDEINEEKEHYIHRERSFESMQRVIRLADVIEEDIKASFDNGVLKIIAPKSKEVVKRKEIPIE